MQQFSLPKARSSPEETNDIANDLKSYDSQPVEVEGQEVRGTGKRATEEDWFEDDEESEEVHASH